MPLLFLVNSQRVHMRSRQDKYNQLTHIYSCLKKITNALTIPFDQPSTGRTYKYEGTQQYREH